jgi:hypothetical protein
MEHTQGPWIASAAVQNNGPNYFVVAPRGWKAPVVATCDNEANARLIAAAPDLLEALMQTLRFAVGFACEARGIPWPEDGTIPEAFAEVPWINKARAAIAKAKER